jgi:glycosyltransferase involved in cell wall biosynthesis
MVFLLNNNMKSKYKYLISIITPCFNSQEHIIETIESVINQTYKNWELILVDDNSNDKTVKIINSFIENDNRIILISSKKNSGSGYSRNLAIDKARGQFYTFLDSDDTWYPKKLQKQLDFILSNNYILTYTNYDVINSKNIRHIKNKKNKKRVNYSDLLKNNHIGCSTVMYNASVVNKYKIFYMSKLRCRQDLSLWLKILKVYDYAYGLDEVLSTYRIRKKSVSSNKIKMVFYQWLLYRKVEKLSFTKCIYFLTFSLFYGINRYFKQIRKN